MGLCNFKCFLSKEEKDGYAFLQHNSALSYFWGEICQMFSTSIQVLSFSRHIELYLYNAKLNQTSRKPQNSPLVTVSSSFQVSSTDRKQFSVSTADLKTTCHSPQW